MKRLLLALLALHNLANAGVILVDEAAAKAAKAAEQSKAVVLPQPVGNGVSASATLASGVAVPAPSGNKAGPVKQAWDVRLEDRTIYGTLDRWAKQANPQWQVVWLLPREFMVAASDSNAPFVGTFEDAVDRVLDSFENSDYPPKGCFHSNNVVRVVRRIGDGLECER